MNPFRRKDAASTKSSADGNDNSSAPSGSHRLTLELKRAETFAAMIARSRASQVIEVSDFLAGMYICNWERISQYWDDHNQQAIQNLLHGICQISPQRWHSWIELYDRQRRESEPRGWDFLRFLKKDEPTEKPLQPSAALATVLKQAEQLAPAYDRAGDRSIPILTSECVLLCIVRNLGSEVSRKLAATGLDVARLEKDVLLPRHRPRS